MNLIYFIFDVIRKLVIFILSMISLVLFAIYMIGYPVTNDPKNIMLWIIVIPLFLISLLVKK